MITWPEYYECYVLEREGDAWAAFANTNGHWYKGLGPSRQEAIDELIRKIYLNHHTGRSALSLYREAERKKLEITAGTLQQIDIGELDL